MLFEHCHWRAPRQWGRLVALAVFWAISQSSLADGDHEDARTLVEAGEILPLETILSKAQDHYPGRVLEVEFEREDGRRIYEVELVDDHGVVREIELDAVSGELLRVKREH